MDDDELTPELKALPARPILVALSPDNVPATGVNFTARRPARSSDATHATSLRTQVSDRDPKLCALSHNGTWVTRCADSPPGYRDSVPRGSGPSRSRPR